MSSNSYGDFFLSAAYFVAYHGLVWFKRFRVENKIRDRAQWRFFIPTNSSIVAAWAYEAIGKQLVFDRYKQTEQLIINYRRAGEQMKSLRTSMWTYNCLAAAAFKGHFLKLVSFQRLEQNGGPRHQFWSVPSITAVGNKIILELCKGRRGNWFVKFVRTSLGVVATADKSCYV